ncbi:MAG: hypothetical protein AAF487_12340 [Bacteroidota bacterium]
MSLLLVLTMVAELADYHHIVPKTIKENTYEVFELIILAGLYYRFFKHRKVFKTLLATSVLLYLCFSLVHFFLFGFWNISILGFSFSHLIMVCCCLYYLYNLFNPPFETQSLLAKPLFWICFGNLLYFIGIYLFIAGRELMSEEGYKSQKILGYVNAFINYMLYTLYLMGAICQRIFK